MDSINRQKEKFPELVYRKNKSGIENLYKLLKISKNWFTRVMNGRHTHIEAKEIVRWASILEIDAPTLIREYGVGMSVLTLEQVNKLYTQAGYSFELPDTIMHAA